MQVPRCTAIVVSCAALGGVLVPASSAAAASCTGTPHDASDHAQIDVSCDTAIGSGGKVTVRTNRGAENVSAHPKIVNGTGALDCTSQEQAPGSAFDSAIACTGSMTAGATAQITAQFGPNPCSSPAFNGDLKVEFGDGSSFGPSALAAYDCSNNQQGGPQPGQDFDPGGVFQGVPKKPPAKASVAKARKGLAFKINFGLKGKIVVFIEVKGKPVGKTIKNTNGGPTALKARLAKSAVSKLKGHTTKAKIHVHVIPDKSEGINQTGEKYFKLKLTG